MADSTSPAITLLPVDQTRQWLDQVVIGLNLCPFAHKPRRLGQIDIALCAASREDDIITALIQQLQRLDKHPAAELETVILVISELLQDFYDYNQFLDVVDAVIEEGGWTGIYQVASFHPQYQFAGTEPGDPENLTNRSPYPLLHIIREESLEAALESYPDSDKIPEVNIEQVSRLTPEECSQLFPYLFVDKT